MTKESWLGIDRLHNQQKEKQEKQLEAVGKECAIYAECFNTAAGKKVLEMIRRDLDEETWNPALGPNFGYYREGQNDILRNINNRVNYAKTRGNK